MPIDTVDKSINLAAIVGDRDSIVSLPEDWIHRYTDSEEDLMRK